MDRNATDSSDDDFDGLPHEAMSGNSNSVVIDSNVEYYVRQRPVEGHPSAVWTDVVIPIRDVIPNIFHWTDIPSDSDEDELSDRRSRYVLSEQFVAERGQRNFDGNEALNGAPIERRTAAQELNSLNGLPEEENRASGSVEAPTSVAVTQTRRKYPEPAGTAAAGQENGEQQNNQH